MPTLRLHPACPAAGEPPRGGDPARRALKREPAGHPTPLVLAECDLSPERLGSVAST